MQTIIDIREAPGVIAYGQRDGREAAVLEPAVRAALEVWPDSDPNVLGIAILGKDGVVRLGTESSLRERSFAATPLQCEVTTYLVRRDRTG